ncbi:MAG: chromosome partitioning protein [Alteromonadaceae bacterium]|jgi:chromosome partitioning protein
MVARVICFAAQKGGVGKTMSTVQAALLTAVRIKKRTLLIDIDPQRNSSGVFLTPEQIQDSSTCCASLLYTKDYVITPTPGKYNIHVIPGDDGINAFPQQDLTDDAFATLIDSLKNNTNFCANDVIKEVVDQQLIAFATNVQKLREDYDFIFIDTPPSFLGLPLLSGLFASTDVVGLLEPNKFSSDVISGFIEKVATVHDQYNPEMTFHGFIINKLRLNSSRHKSRVENWMSTFPDFFLSEPVRINSWLEDCTEDGEPCWIGANNQHRRTGANLIINALSSVIPELRKADNE